LAVASVADLPKAAIITVNPLAYDEDPESCPPHCTGSLGIGTYSEYGVAFAGVELREKTLADGEILSPSPPLMAGFQADLSFFSCDRTAFFFLSRKVACAKKSSQ
jgi:hypothetical protein